jgi:hypothetical protein
MKRHLVLIPVVAILAACSSAPRDPYERRAYEEREKQEKFVERALDKAPDWMTKLPQSNNAVYANGTAVSHDFSMADEKAKVIAMGKICTSAGGEVDKSSSVYRMDTETATNERSELAIRSMCRKVDVTGAEVAQIKRVAEGTRFRTYVLLALPTGDANRLQKAKLDAEVSRQAARRSAEVFKEIDKKPAQ